jgi:hypothetical protein
MPYANDLRLSALFQKITQKNIPLKYCKRNRTQFVHTSNNQSPCKNNISVFTYLVKQKLVDRQLAEQDDNT